MGNGGVQTALKPLGGEGVLFAVPAHGRNAAVIGVVAQGQVVVEEAVYMGSLPGAVVLGKFYGGCTETHLDQMRSIYIIEVGEYFCRIFLEISIPTIDTDDHGVPAGLKGFTARCCSASKTFPIAAVVMHFQTAFPLSYISGEERKSSAVIIVGLPVYAQGCTGNSVKIENMVGVSVATIHTIDGVRILQTAQGVILSGIAAVRSDAIDELSLAVGVEFRTGFSKIERWPLSLTNVRLTEKRYQGVGARSDAHSWIVIREAGGVGIKIEQCVGIAAYILKISQFNGIPLIQPILSVVIQVVNCQTSAVCHLIIVHISNRKNTIHGLSTIGVTTFQG